MKKVETMLLWMMMNKDGIRLQFLVWLMTRLAIFLPFVPNTGISVGSLLRYSFCFLSHL